MYHVIVITIASLEDSQKQVLLSEVISTAQVQRTHLGIIKKTHHLLALAQVGLVLVISSKDFQCFMFQERDYLVHYLSSMWAMIGYYGCGLCRYIIDILDHALVLAEVTHNPLYIYTYRSAVCTNNTHKKKYVTWNGLGIHSTVLFKGWCLYFTKPQTKEMWQGYLSHDSKAAPYTISELCLPDYGPGENKRQTTLPSPFVKSDGRVVDDFKKLKR